MIRENGDMDMLSDEMAARILVEIGGLLDDRLESVVLYGSYAKGEQTVDSDIDLLIVVNIEFGSWRERRTLEAELRHVLYTIGCISPKVISLKELRTSLAGLNPLLLNIFHQGQILKDSGIYISTKARFDNMVTDGVITKEADHWAIAI